MVRRSRLLGANRLEGAAALGTGSLVFFTIDPLDGTKAFVRRESRGVDISGAGT
jgi:3'-phosphoadenosine 5'-phosphosulfate (PAPS) 3'-phosphatase